MGFFLHDLHQNIEQRHSDQVDQRLGESSSPLIVYRGQGMSNALFKKMRECQGGLISFNNFLSTSVDKSVAYMFAESNKTEPDKTGILFRITVDNSISSVSFTFIHDVTAFSEEQECLFSMHAVFRINEFERLDESGRFWQVNIALTSDKDQLLETLTYRLRDEIDGITHRHQLSQLIIKLGHFDMAEQMNRVLLDQAVDTEDQAYLNHQLGYIKASQGDYQEAMSFFEKSFELIKQFSPLNDHRFLAAYSNIGLLYDKMGEYSKALPIHQEVLEIKRKCLPSNPSSHRHLYSIMRSVNIDTNECLKELTSFEKELEICQNSLPLNHVDLAASYTNIAWTYGKLSDWLKGLLYHEKSLDIYLNASDTNNRALAACYRNIAFVHEIMGDYSKAKSFNEKAIEQCEIYFPSNQSSSTMDHTNTDSVQENMKTLLQNKIKYLHPNHPDLIRCYNYIGSVYSNMGEYSKAVSHFEEDLEVCRNYLPSNHPDLAISYSNIGSMYAKMAEYTKALAYYGKGLDIIEKSFPTNHPDWAMAYNNIGSVNFIMGGYVEALEF
ncbi:unnamed protein product [Rotaria magnacalcarata]|uniref:Uncharacterized protein n=1 Tax=Rotaria magnacalcarata TaxID=392030 RepID=A0A816TLK1_9BILA|nr:unnamed protein product [Rotaria magnacalcarata]CAF4105571.1 unnamed protein product [Rotaria magnacalcarata]